MEYYDALQNKSRPVLGAGGYMLVGPIFREIITLHAEFNVTTGGIQKDLGTDYDKLAICIECADENMRIDFSDEPSGYPGTGEGKRVLALDEVCFIPTARYVRMVTDAGTAKAKILRIGQAK